MYKLKRKDVNRDFLTNGAETDIFRSAASWLKKAYIKEYVNLFNYLSEQLNDTDLSVLDSEYLYNITIDKVDNNRHNLYLSESDLKLIVSILVNYMPVNYDFQIDWHCDIDQVVIDFH